MADFLANLPGVIYEMPFAIWETFYITVLATFFALVLGLPLGVLLVVGEKDGVLPLPGWVLKVLDVNGSRALCVAPKTNPFIVIVR